MCAATLVIENPRNPLAPLSLALFDNAINLYSSVVQGNTSTRIVQNLKWLQRLRQRAGERMRQAEGQPDGEGLPQPEEGGINDVELLGWRTRLVKRAVQGRTAMTVSASPATTVSPDTAVMPAFSNKDNTQSAEDLVGCKRWGGADGSCKSSGSHCCCRMCRMWRMGSRGCSRGIWRSTSALG